MSHHVQRNNVLNSPKHKGGSIKYMSTKKLWPHIALWASGGWQTNEKERRKELHISHHSSSCWVITVIPMAPCPTHPRILVPIVVILCAQHDGCHLSSSLLTSKCLLPNSRVVIIVAVSPPHCWPGPHCCSCGGIIVIPLPIYHCSPFLPHKQWLVAVVEVAVVVAVSLGMGLSFHHCCVIGTQLDSLD